MADVIQTFIDKVKDIYNSNPKRREPGDGSDGYCDCIGLPIGAVRRMGLKWKGIHGTNWTARYGLVELKKINSASDLNVGDVVLKHRTYGDARWRLPARYHNGGKYYNRDMNDYYHAGVVVSVNPLKIMHMSDKMTTDTKLGKWSYHGLLKVLKNAGAVQVSAPSGTNVAANKYAVVVAPSGKTVNMRKKPSTVASIVVRVPVNSTVTLLEPGETWARIQYGNTTGYMMAKFLDVIGDGKGNY